MSQPGRGPTSGPLPASASQRRSPPVLRSGRPRTRSRASTLEDERRPLRLAPPRYARSAASRSASAAASAAPPPGARARAPAFSRATRLVRPEPVGRGRPPSGAAVGSVRRPAVAAGLAGASRPARPPEPPRLLPRLQRHPIAEGRRLERAGSRPRRGRRGAGAPGVFARTVAADVDARRRDRDEGRRSREAAHERPERFSGGAANVTLVPSVWTTTQAPAGAGSPEWADGEDERRRPQSARGSCEPRLTADERGGRRHAPDPRSAPAASRPSSVRTPCQQKSSPATSSTRDAGRGPSRTRGRPLRRDTARRAGRGAPVRAP